MDYNYVRMRNALKNGELEKAEEYKLLYEGAKTKKRKISVLDYTIVLLLSVTVLLGVYILHSQVKLAENNNEVTQEVTESEAEK